VISDTGRLLGTLSVSTDTTGYLDLLTWANSFGQRAMRRSRGKSDPTDAENAARAVLSGRATAIPKEQSGAAEAMRAVSVARRSAVKARTQAINQLRLCS
jgi:hypothetical protein